MLTSNLISNLQLALKILEVKELLEMPDKFRHTEMSERL